MKKYKVTLTVTADEFMLVFQNLRGTTIAFDVKEIEQSVAGKPEGEPVQRRKRNSKVVETILETLKNGEARISDLKSGLGRAGLSENSLSTGLAVLQKNGKIKRSGDGFYALADAA